MSVIETEPPAISLLGGDRIETATFRDSYRAPLSIPDRDIIALFAAVFGHKPMGVKLGLVARNLVARLFGLDVPTIAQVMDGNIQGPYAVGDLIGPWPICALNSDEMVAGRDNSHMDFRLSVLRSSDGTSVQVTTICHAHNAAGRLYMRVIEPFHRAGVRLLMSNAVAAGRL